MSTIAFQPLRSSRTIGHLGTPWAFVPPPCQDDGRDGRPHDGMRPENGQSCPLTPVCVNRFTAEADIRLSPRSGVIGTTVGSLGGEI